MAGSNRNSSYYDLYGEDSYTPTPKQVTPVVAAVQTPKQSPFYQKQAFDKEELFKKQYGTLASRRDKRQFEKYWNSDQRQADELAHEKAEGVKYMASIDQYINKSLGREQPVQQPTSPSFYQKQDFKTNKLAELYGSNPSKRDLKQFNDYLNSEQGQADWLAHEKQESSKYLASFDAYAENALKPILTAKMPAPQPVGQTPTLPKQEVISPAQPSSEPIAQPKPQIVPRTVRSNEEWNQIARQNGFADVAAVRQWQSQNGLTVDGKLGNTSLRKLQELKAAAEQQAASQINNQPAPVNTPATETVVTPPKSQMVDPAFKYQRPNERFFRYHYNGTEDVKMGNDTYPVFVTRSESISKNNKWGLKGDESYAYDPATGRVRRLQENMFGMIQDQGDLKTPKWVEGEDWIDISDLPTPYRGGVHKNKQGGTMNKINYLKLGGKQQSAQDVQQQIRALVMAAMNEADPKHKDAIKAVNQINAAADQGDPQAQQLAEMIQQEVEQLQSQARAAKWGAKLNYVRSLKYARGGKTCPACEAKQKMIEQQACGGKAKKAKKRYFGGWL